MKLAARLLCALALAACNASGSSGIPVTANGQTNFATAVPQWQATHAARRACTDFRPGYMHCEALLINEPARARIVGLVPVDFQTRYHLPSARKGSGQIVAIVDAFDNPNVASDLARYRSTFGLATANFTKYNQEGRTKNFPPGDIHWGSEIDLDVEMVSATCPRCTIYLIESNDNSGRSLFAAEKEAVKLGAHIVSNSWGGVGGPSRGAFDAPGVTYLASAGDGGYGLEDPADYNSVVSVGGAVLSKRGSTYDEVVWSDTGGGCSVIHKPWWQSDPKCSFRTGNDVAAVAWNAAVYDTYGYRGWGMIGGTSISAPLLAGVYGLAGDASRHQSGETFWGLRGKESTTELHEISTGTMIHCPPSLDGSYLCSAGTGKFKTYSAPAGWGTPDGIGAF